MLCDEDARLINSQIKEPFIQKYLKSLAVHVCTLPITQIVSVLVAIVYVLRHPELSLGQAWAAAGLILVAFQVTPISPGSLVRGLYVVYLVIRERNFKDYNIAVFLGFFKYVGYLAFPIQMTYRYPALARFMAGHWATSAVHFVPVFGERGALLEHGVFDAFYNYPLTVRRRMRRRGQLRSARKLRYWHGALCVLGGFAALSVIDLLYVRIAATVPSFWDVWYLALWPAVLAGAAAAIWAGGAQAAARIKLAAACGALIAVLHAGSNTALACVFPPIATESPQAWGVLGGALPALLWRVFAFTIAAVFGAFITEARPLSTHRTAT
jgi:hypothetical protein